jgi:SAM-dependent methyltransferase
MWDTRYAGDDYVYGTAPNDFLTGQLDRLPRGRALCLGEGEGRNAVFLAQQGYEVLAVDASTTGMAKARRLARERGVEIETRVADLAVFPIAPGQWDLIVSVFCHLPPPLRRNVHRAAVAGLRPGGAFLLEAYTPRQLEFRTGGPPTHELLMSLASLREELRGLTFIHAVETEREVVEGSLHTGRGAVVQVLALKD